MTERLRSGALLAGSGIAFMAVLFLAVWYGVGVLNSGGLLPNSDTALQVFLVCWAVLSILLFRVLRTWVGAVSERLLLIMFWTLSYIALWMLGAGLGRVSLPLFVGFWLVAGVVGGLLGLWPHGGTQKARARSGSPVDRASQYGRIPVATLQLIQSQVQAATSAIATALPAGTDVEMRHFTVEAVLARTLRDWWENGNTDGLRSQDMQDLRSFVELTASLAGDLGVADNRAFYRATLDGLLDDWLVAWNANGIDGPPVRMRMF
jgi:hypothetical protein